MPKSCHKCNKMQEMLVKCRVLHKNVSVCVASEDESVRKDYVVRRAAKKDEYVCVCSGVYV